jgi:hypothetical protein
VLRGYGDWNISRAGPNWGALPRHDSKTPCDVSRQSIVLSAWALRNIALHVLARTTQSYSEWGGKGPSSPDEPGGIYNEPGILVSCTKASRPAVRAN